MAQINGYKEELQDELQKTDPNSHASRLLAQEIERLEKGEDRKDSRSIAFIDVHQQQPQPVGLKVRIPIQEFPKFNFVGKLLGPKGNTLKRLQEETGCKMAILGKGSMRDKAKEEEMRKEGGKFAHLNDELHVYVEVFAEVTDGYRRLSHAVAELKKFLIPTLPSGLDEEQQLILSQEPALIQAFCQLLSQQRAPMFQPRGPLLPQRTPLLPPRGPVLSPRGPMLTPRRPMFPPRGPVFPPQRPMFPFQLQSPMKKPKIRRPSLRRKPTPWYKLIREEFHLLKRRRRQAERKWQKSKLPADREAYIAAKKTYNELIRTAKFAIEGPKKSKKTREELAKDSESPPEESKTLTKELSEELLDEESLSECDDSSDDCSDDVAKGTEDSAKDPSQVLEGNDDIRQQQLQEMMYLQSEGPPGGRGGFRGGPAGRGAPAPGRGAPRGGAPGRGAPRGGAAPPRGGASAMRGAARGRGGGAPPQTSSYDDYGYGGSSRGAGGGGYEDGYDTRGYGDSSYGGGQGDGQYYGGGSYGSGAQSAGGSYAGGSYDDYSGYTDYGDSWGTNGSGGGPMKAGRGGAKPRSHPYGSGRGGY